jgi:hypothetical protein
MRLGEEHQAVVVVVVVVFVFVVVFVDAGTKMPHRTAVVRSLRRSRHHRFGIDRR